MLDWERIQAIELSGRGMQLGYTAKVASSPAFDAANVVGAQVVRFQGEKWDLSPWRVYLAPWGAQPGLLTNSHDAAIVADFPAVEQAQPTDPPPVALIPFAAAVSTALAGQLTTYAVIKWGSGGVQHRAVVDWPNAGMLLQVSGSYVEVDAIIIPRDFNSIGPDETLGTKLPTLAATLAPEPGGGDSARSATFTFQLQSALWDLESDPAVTGINFPIPPFARACYFAWNNAGPVDDTANYATSARIQFFRANEQPGGGGDSSLGTYIYEFLAGDIGDPRDGVPIPPNAAYVRVEFTWPALATPVAAVGVSFELDL